MESPGVPGVPGIPGRPSFPGVPGSPDSPLTPSMPGCPGIPLNTGTTETELSMSNFTQPNHLDMCVYTVCGLIL